MTHNASNMLGILLILLTSASADSTEAPRFENHITPETTTSQCIGNPITPICAFETYQACIVLSRSELCAAVGVEGVRFPGSGGYSYSYSILALRQLTQEDIQAMPRPFRWAKAGNVDIRIEAMPCLSGEPCAIVGVRSSKVVVLEPVGKLWHVVGWATDVGDIACEYYQPDDEFEQYCRFIMWGRDFSDYDAVLRATEK